jgi:hypothetical protein
VDDVVDLNGLILDRLLGLFGRGVGTNVLPNVLASLLRVDSFAARDSNRNKASRTDTNGAFSNHGAVGLEDNTVNLLEVVRVRDYLVAREDILFNGCGALAVSCCCPSILLFHVLSSI